MKPILRPFLVALPMTLIGACSLFPQQPAGDEAATPARASAPAPAQIYVCESGAVINAAYPDTDSATLHYRGHTLQLKIAISASGARYVDERLEWWTKGSGPGAQGTLLRHNADGTSGDVLERCAGR